MRRLPLGASSWMFRRPVGPVVSWWLAAASSRHWLGGVGARSWGRRGCRSGGSGISPLLCCVEAVERRLWSCGRQGRRLVMERSLGAGVDAGAAALDASPPLCCVEVTSAMLHRGRLVSACVARASWSSTRVVHGFGAGVDVGAAAPDSPFDVLRLGVLVSAMVAWATWSSTRVGAWPRGRRGWSCTFFILGLVLLVCFYFINIKGKTFASFQKKG